jgi:hypothetical protein
MRDTLLKAKSGQLSQVSYDNLMRLTQIMKLKAQANMRQANQKAAKLLSRTRPNIDEKKALSYLDPMYDGSEELPSSGAKKTTDIQSISKPSTTVDEDGAAIKWATSPKNLKDPRAVRIRKEHGLE